MAPLSCAREVSRPSSVTARSVKSVSRCASGTRITSPGRVAPPSLWRLPTALRNAPPIQDVRPITRLGSRGPDCHPIVRHEGCSRDICRHQYWGPSPGGCGIADGSPFEETRRSGQLAAGLHWSNGRARSLTGCSSMLWLLLSDQHCGAQGTGERQPGRYPQHRAIARDECILDGLPPARVSRFGGR
jgi:hypothetical protein